MYATLKTAADIAIEETSVTAREGGCLGEGEELGNREREIRDCETTAASEREREGGEKKVKHGPTGLDCQYKPSSGESCHRLGVEGWRGGVGGERHCAISPTATLHPSHTPS